MATIAIIFDKDRFKGAHIFPRRAIHCFMQRTKQQRLASRIRPTRLSIGDTHATLAGTARLFCIQVEYDRPDVGPYLKAQFESMKSEGVTVLDRPVDGSLVALGQVESDGRFHPATGFGEMCAVEIKETGWADPENAAGPSAKKSAPRKGLIAWFSSLFGARVSPPPPVAKTQPRSPAAPLVLTCANCRTVFNLGVNAYVVSAESLQRDMAAVIAGRSVLPQALGGPSPDTIRLDQDQERIRKRADGLNDVLAAKRRRGNRQWKCDVCNSVHDYQW